MSTKRKSGPRRGMKPRFGKRRKSEQSKYLAKDLDNLSEDEVEEEDENNPPAEEGDLQRETRDEGVEHKESLNRLQKTDPEFYRFLQENDKDLLNFEDSSSDSEADDALHKAPDHLQVASDDSEFEETAEEERKKKKKSSLTIRQIEEWRIKLKEPKPIEEIVKVIRVFKTLVQDLQQNEAADGAKNLRVQGSVAFNGIIRLCIMDLFPAINRMLRAPVGKSDLTNFNPTAAKSWSKLQAHVRTYVMNLVQMLPEVASEAIIKVLLRHVLQLVPYFIPFPKTTKALLKKLVSLWSTAEDSVRVLAVVCIARLAHKLSEDSLEIVYKSMYMAYVKNCKFTSPVTWPSINFMKHSLVEVFGLNQVLLYQHAFAYVRQLGIHLRNAIMLKKKDSIKTVYNWQYVHCLYLWSHCLGALHPSPIMQPLIHPLTQIIMGAIKLVPSAKYIPLRYHCIRMLTTLSGRTGTYIPILPFLIEVFEIVNFGKKHQRISWKPLDFTCALKLSKSQLEENSFKDAVVEQFYELMMDYLNVVSHTIGFPELALTTTLQMRSFLKVCKVVNYNKQIRQLMDKINENSQLISEKRKSVTFSLADTKAVENWQHETQQEGTPISRYYAAYRKLRDKEISLSMSQKEQLDDYDLPTVNRKALLQNKKKEDKIEFADLFASDSGSDDDSKEQNTPTKTMLETAEIPQSSTETKAPKAASPTTSNKRKKKVAAGNKKQKLVDEIKAFTEDIVEDLDISSADEKSINNLEDDEDSDVSF